MKTEQFIQMLEKNLAEDLIKRAKENGGSIVWNGIEIKVPVEKDPWEGVEFARYGPDHFFCIESRSEEFLVSKRGESYIKYRCTAVTQEQYEKHISLEIIKRFKNPRVGDVFDLSVFGLRKDAQITRSGINDLRYYKEDDSMSFKGVILYRQGKWATKLEKRIKVRTDLTMEENFSAHNWVETEAKEIQFNYSFFLNRNAYGINPEKAYHFLADQLESFLNGEQPEAQPSKLSLFITGLEIQNSHYHTNKDLLERPIFNELSLSTKLNLRAVGDFSKYIKGTQVDEESIAEDIMSGKLKIGA